MSDVHAVEDLVADTFVKAFDAQQRGQGSNSHLSGWLFRIAHNLIIDYYAWRDRRQHLNLDDVAHKPCADALPLDELVQASLDRELLATAIQQLKADQSEAVRRRLEGYRYDEIGEIMQRSEGAAKTLHRRAEANLRVMLVRNSTHEPI